jgi:hypothetical protein
VSTLLIILIALAGAIATSTATALIRPRLRARAEAEARLRAVELAKKAGFSIGLGQSLRIGSGDVVLDGAWILADDGHALAAIWFQDQPVAITLRPPNESVYRARAIKLKLPKVPPAVLDLEGNVHARYHGQHVQVLPLGNAKAPPWTKAMWVEYRTVDRQSFFAITDGSVTRAWRTRPTTAVQQDAPAEQTATESAAIAEGTAPELATDVADASDLKA